MTNFITTLNLTSLQFLNLVHIENNPIDFLCNKSNFILNKKLSYLILRK